MLGGLALKWRWRQPGGGGPAGRAQPGDGRQRAGRAGRSSAATGTSSRGSSPVGPRPPASNRRRRSAHCDENTIGVVADPRLDLRRRLRAGRGDRRSPRRAGGRGGPGRADPRGRRRRAASSRRSSTRSSSGTSACRACARSTPRGTSTGWSTRASAGWCGATPRRLPDELVFHVDYLGGDMPTFALNFSRPGGPGRRRSTTTSSGWASRATRASSRRAATPREWPPAGRGVGPFELLSDGAELPVFFFRHPARASPTTRSTTSPRPCASRAGTCPRTRCREGLDRPLRPARRGAQRLQPGPGATAGARPSVDDRPAGTRRR